MLRKAGLTKNLFFEIKEKVIEETFEGPGAIKKKKRVTKVYGLDSTKSVRDLLMEILRERMENHKDKFVTKRLYEEFIGLEVKRNGKIEHSANTHDDLTFSYLMALYVWYEGKNLKENFGIEKASIKTDEDVDDIVFEPGVETVEIYEETERLQNELLSDATDSKSPMDKYDELKSQMGILYGQWMEQEEAKEKEALKQAFRDERFLKAYAYKYHLTKDDVDLIRSQTKDNELPPEAFIDGSLDKEYSHIQGNLAKYYNKV